MFACLNEPDANIVNWFRASSVELALHKYDSHVTKASHVTKPCNWLVTLLLHVLGFWLVSSLSCGKGFGQFSLMAMG